MGIRNAEREYAMVTEMGIRNAERESAMGKRESAMVNGNTQCRMRIRYGKTRIRK